MWTRVIPQLQKLDFVERVVLVLRILLIKPYARAEQELKALLIKFLDYRNKHDVDGLILLFRSDAEVRDSTFG